MLHQDSVKWRYEYLCRSISPAWLFISPCDSFRGTRKALAPAPGNGNLRVKMPYSRECLITPPFSMVTHIFCKSLCPFPYPSIQKGIISPLRVYRRLLCKRGRDIKKCPGNNTATEEIKHRCPVLLNLWGGKKEKSYPSYCLHAILMPFICTTCSSITIP